MLATASMALNPVSFTACFFSFVVCCLSVATSVTFISLWKAYALSFRFVFWLKCLMIYSVTSPMRLGSSSARSVSMLHTCVFSISSFSFMVLMYSTRKGSTFLSLMASTMV